MKKHNLFIDGEWVESPSYIPNINPSDTTDVIGEFAGATPNQVDEAVTAAKKAASAWRFVSPQVRFNALDFIGTEILARAKELGDLLSREEGKTLPEGIGEVQRAGQIFKFFAGEALRNTGDNQMSVRPGVMVDTVREPLGIVGLITPWNFPIAIPAWKIAPALAFGNCVLFKPAEIVPASAWALAEIISRSGIPKGVFNLLMGSGKTVGEKMIHHKGIDAISFTGSQTTGKLVAQACVSRLKKFQLEMGGKNPLIILDDADLNTAVNAAIQGSFYSTGQRCTASSRLIVTEKIHDAFVAAMVAKMKSLRVGDARAEGTDIGPVVDAVQLKKNLEYVAIGQSEGATLVAGGEAVPYSKQGYYMTPGLFTETKNAMRINEEEIFGPIASVICVSNYEEALLVANDTPFGLTAGICTTSLKSAHHFKQHAEAGMIMVNLPTAGVDFHVPFGGKKGSSYGAREQGVYAREFYTTIKTTYMHP